MGFSPGFSGPALKRMTEFELFSRNAEALLPSAEAEGSHQSVEGDGLQAVRYHLKQLRL
jgi:hypothetical protein